MGHRQATARGGQQSSTLSSLKIQLPSEIRTCLKSELLCVCFSGKICAWNPNFYVWISDTFVQCLKFKLFENLTVIECLKSTLVRISDTYCNDNLCLRKLPQMMKKVSYHLCNWNFMLNDFVLNRSLLNLCKSWIKVC